MVSTIQWSVVAAFENLWESFVLFLPDFFGAVVVLIVGWVIALALARVATHVLEVIKVDKAVQALRLSHAFEKAGLRLDVARLFGWLVKWFLLVVTFLAVADILQWTQLSQFLNLVVSYLPNVIIAAVILLVGILLSNFVHGVVRHAVEAANLEGGHFLAGVAKWAILVFAALAALNQLQIAAELVRILFTAFVAMLAIAGGLAFGLGGQEHASKFLNRLRKDITSEK